MLERVSNPRAGTLYAVRFTAPEFTSLCPMTGQPDFAHLVIDYVPGDWLVESKSLKLYLTSFRNHGAFHEDCTVSIGTRLSELLAPVWLRIGGYWYPRGGFRSTCSIRPDLSQRTSGSPIRACHPTAGEVDRRWRSETFVGLRDLPILRSSPRAFRWQTG